jgi:hypothetical protein
MTKSKTITYTVLNRSRDCPIIFFGASHSKYNTALTIAVIKYLALSERNSFE